jgi:uncharacterized membrane protein YdjX (TVP38/TMEM64 family)
VAGHRIVALASFVALYVVTVSLGIPGGAILTMAGGIVFGAFGGALSAIVAGSIGATIIFAVARSAAGEWLVALAGPRAMRLARGFREGAFNYLLFLRLVPLFPFWLVNIVPALCGVGLGPFFAATLIGIMPAACVYALFGAGLDSALVAQESAYRACVAAAAADCRLDFHIGAAVTPELLAALVGLGLLALLPLAARCMRPARTGDAA